MFCRRDFVYFEFFDVLIFMLEFLLEVQWVKVWIFDSFSL